MPRDFPILRGTSMRHSLVMATALLLFAGCGGHPKHAPMVAANANIGDCANPRTSGVLSSAPSLRSAHRDLNGDGRKEKVFADRNLCRGENCSWNIFTESEGCSRYLGTIAGATLEVGSSQGEAGFAPVHAWWRLPSGARHLVQNYRYRSGGYQLIDVLICRQGGDDTLLCASEEPHDVL